MATPAARVGVTSDYVNLVLPATLVFGAGLGLTISASVSSATAGVEQADTGVASAMVNVGQQVGGSIGTSLLNTLAASAAASFLAVHVHAPQAAALAALAALHGYRTGFTWSAVILLAAAVSTATLLHRSSQAAVTNAAPAGAPVGAAPAGVPSGGADPAQAATPEAAPGLEVSCSRC
jgi:hypothetical protein